MKTITPYIVIIVITIMAVLLYKAWKDQKNFNNIIIETKKEADSKRYQEKLSDPEVKKSFAALKRTGLKIM